ncbi:MAG: ribosomal-protein-alanine acetyltransferase [Brevundimonas subvibrioides]|uniref:Ribosomal-protein-alanine acetyltransferase n=1 Tax=Brevundimonas subvibrioides TaxID=74313 RepID=A0A258HPM4_9CAUL|nr:GNAT family N-acetyltransferase [Brevundimonas subvibrioides]OYX58283.1 MAG: ribosomal-protein-alanine acetyltransferase [Brevundimonas subvibrioides]
MTAVGDLARGLADLHAAAFDAPWPAKAFADLLGQAGVFLEGEADGFVLIRTVADEAEILTLAVRPAARRKGLGARLLRAATVRAAAIGATRMFLEVAEDNAPARALYGALGFEAAGRRPRYYPRADGPAVDALLLVLNLV